MLILCLSSLASAGGRAKFPGTVSELKSPNGKLTIKNIDLEGDVQLSHQLVLTDTAAGTSRILYEYGRHVEVLWSPDSSALVVIDYEGSSSARTILFRFVQSLERIDLESFAADWLRESKRQSLVGCGHKYITAKGWTSAQALKLHIEAYGCPGAYSISTDATYSLREGATSFREK
jgi:RHS repeat-associated protein